MARVKRGTTANKRRKNVLKHAKGFALGRKSKYRLAKQALMKAWTYAYRDRKAKKSDFRKLWQIQINAACRENGISYSKFINLLRKKAIIIDRKILSQLANEKPETFKKLLGEAKNNEK